MKINHSVFIIIVALFCIFCNTAMQVKTKDTDLRSESDYTLQTQNQSAVFDQCCANNELFDIAEERCVPLINATIDNYISKQNQLSFF